MYYYDSIYIDPAPRYVYYKTESLPRNISEEMNIIREETFKYYNQTLELEEENIKLKEENQYYKKKSVDQEKTIENLSNILSKTNLELNNVDSLMLKVKNELETLKVLSLQKCIHIENINNELMKDNNNKISLLKISHAKELKHVTEPLYNSLYDTKLEYQNLKKTFNTCKKENNKINKQLELKEEEIKKLNNTLKIKEEHIKNFKAKDEEYYKLNKFFELKDDEIRKLNRTLKIKDEQINELDKIRGNSVSVLKEYLDKVDNAEKKGKQYLERAELAERIIKEKQSEINQLILSQVLLRDI